MLFLSVCLSVCVSPFLLLSLSLSLSLSFSLSALVEGVARQFGLSQPLVLQLLEQLPSVEKCSRHEFHYHNPAKLSSWQEVVSNICSHSL